MMARRLVGWCAACVVMLVSGSAHAQIDLDFGDEFDDLFTTTTVGVVGLTGTVMTGMLYISISAATGNREQEIVIYLGENEAAARAAVLMGGGEAATDLAQLFGVSPANEARFGRMLRASRGALLAQLPAGGPTGEQAGRFIALVIEGMRADEALGADVAYWEARRVAQ